MKSKIIQLPLLRHLLRLWPSVQALRTANLYAVHRDRLPQGFVAAALSRGMCNLEEEEEIGLRCQLRIWKTRTTVHLACELLKCARDQYSMMHEDTSVVSQRSVRPHFLGSCKPFFTIWAGNEDDFSWLHMQFLSTLFTTLQHCLLGAGGRAP